MAQNMGLNFRAVEVFRPYANEFPDALLGNEVATADWDACLQRWENAEMLRIAKLAGEVVGVYAMDRGEAPAFVLHGLIVAPRLRKQGLGRWLTGHALGVAESKGARCVVMPASGSSRCFARMGFVGDPHGLRFDLIPE